MCERTGGYTAVTLLSVSTSRFALKVWLNLGKVLSGELPCTGLVPNLQLYFGLLCCDVNGYHLRGSGTISFFAPLFQDVSCERKEFAS